MTEQELRELDAWIAEHAFGWRIVDLAKINGKEYKGPLWWSPDYGDPLNPKSGAMPHHIPLTYSSSNVCFSIVKREIERRGWSWYASWSPRHEGQQYYFSVDSGGALKTKPYSIIHTEMADTEELAGCLAFKAAVEATNGESAD